MNATQRAIEDAVKGCYLYCGLEKPVFDPIYLTWDVSDGDGGFVSVAKEEMLLDPSFWRALGKERGWGENCTVCNSKANGLCSAHKYSTWNGNMHGLIDALASGSSIEEYFISLEK